MLLGCFFYYYFLNLVLMKVLEEEGKKRMCGSRATWAEQGLGGLGGKAVKLQWVEKPYLLKHTVWNGIFPTPLPQIKMLKHNKCTVHLTSSQAPSATQSPLCPTESLFLLSSKLRFLFAACICELVHLCARACVCLRWRACTRPLGQKNYRNWELLALD